MEFVKNQNFDNSNDISVFVSGDFCPVSYETYSLITKNTVKDIFGEIENFIHSADLSITNLECPLTVSKRAIKKIGPNIKAHPDTAKLLKEAGFDMVTLANNHIYDFGRKGLVDTLETLNKNGLDFVGAGLDLSEAQKTYFKKINGIKLAIVNFAEVEFSCADAEHGGANPMDLIDNVRQIQKAREKSDHVIVIIHGGHVHYQYPSPNTLQRYRFYAESGASIVIGHHTHCLGGYELFEGVPIFYSLGNFFFPALHQNQRPSWHEGYALLLNISKKSISFEIVPFEQCKNDFFGIDRSRHKELCAKIEKINLVLNDERQVTDQWNKYINEKNLYYLNKISGFGSYKTRVLRRLGLINFFYRKQQLINVHQFIRCEAHKEAAGSILAAYLKNDEE